MANGEKSKEEVLLGEIAGTLRAIKGWVAFLGIVVLVGGLIGGCIMTAGAFAGTASIISSFKSPCNPTTRGIDYHDGYIYIGDGQNYIYRTTTTGSLLDSLYVGNASWGIDRTHIEFWSCNRGGFVFRLSTSGSILRSFGGLVYPGYGATYGEGFIWYSTAATLYKLTANGSTVNSFRLPLPRAYRGLCWDAPYLWIADNRGSLQQITQAGSVVESFGVVGVPYGVTWDGSYLWYTAGVWVYKVQVNFTAATPASIGKVKALYR